MKPVEELHHISSELAVWQEYDPSVKVDCTSTALATPEGWLLIDPIPLADSCLAELMAMRPFAGIVLTSGNHQRASLDLRAKLGLRIYAPLAPDLVFDEELTPGAGPWRGVEIYPVRGAGPREIAVRLGTLMVFGDAVIHLGELTVLPDKYCEDPKALRACLKQLTELDLNVACVAHGWPIRERAFARIRAILG